MLRNYTIMIAAGNAMPMYVHATVEEAEGENDLITKWVAQRENRAAYFTYPNGRLLMHYIIGVFRN
ncbi:hypothetical protein [Paenibacillus sp. MMO-58]|uniref:hypothetical protein n=1 Tax=Paenibacillus sp. MMO-58 TaxID=3081290 RepID=UPI0030159A9F